ncbi:MAG: MerC family mercury resistance protein [Bryobacteraceae bacterium]
MKQNLLAVPAILLSVLPPLGGCPACWPVYGGVLSALGLGFLLSSRYLLPLTALFLFIALFTLAFRARTRRGYGPFAVGLVAAAVILCGKFSLESNALAYSGVALLTASSLWNSWPRQIAAPHCPKCAPSDTGFIQLSAWRNHHEYEQTKD